MSINWHLNPLAQRIMLRISPSQIEGRLQIAAHGDFVTYAGADRFTDERIMALRVMREEMIDEALGYSFGAAHNDTQRRAWLAAEDACLSIEQALDEAFCEREVDALAPVRSTFGMIAA